MKAKVIRIGNSRGVRLPKGLIEEAGLGEDIEVSVEEEAIVIRPLRRPRHGWDEAFRRMGKRGDDELLDLDQVSNNWDEAEWQW
jgi:antitoxin MazE